MSSPAPPAAAPESPGGAKRAGATAGRIARSTFSAVLIVLTCVLVPLTLVAVWVHDIVLDTDRYVSTVAPLARNRAVQDAAVARITKAVDVRVNGPEAADQLAAWLKSQGLPPKAVQAVKGLGPQLDSAVDDTVHKAATRVVRSDRFAATWENANRTVHRAVVHALTGEGQGAVNVTDGTVTLDVGTAVDNLKKELEAEGVPVASAIPSSDKQLVLLDSDQLGKIRKLAHALDVLGNWLPLLTVVVGAAGVLLAHRRRRALARAALGAAFASLVVAIVLAVFRGYYLDHLPATVQSHDAAAAVYDTLIHFLRVSLVTAIVLGIVIALGAYLVGPGRLPVAVRGTSERTSDSIALWAYRNRIRTGRTGVWTDRHRRWITLAVLLVIAAAFAFWNHPTALTIFFLLLVLLVLLALIALLAASGRAARDAGSPAGHKAQQGG
ncbi:hypothetical protein NMG29_24170 [Streptomyces cocklensis]|uniref:Aromatic ring-opening dioxygenase LigA n=1 Tax=Actinacidiphila cocklensis TaxID=887465 RepID=A0A9W4DTC4_9ACTN|nr:hypothetical protein [Actinacidiphila cocklensis]MDD1061274.1 hypothetical protein [Actinacidiphila cocklensis]CAG6395836.1 conserved membrane hypothetical protein [Actinacidiphila cocklensis]